MQVLKLILETEHLQCWVLELFLLVLFCTGLIYLELVEYFCKKKNLILL